MLLDLLSLPNPCRTRGVTGFIFCEIRKDTSSEVSTLCSMVERYILQMYSPTFFSYTLVPFCRARGDPQAPRPPRPFDPRAFLE